MVIPKGTLLYFCKFCAAMFYISILHSVNRNYITIPETILSYLKHFFQNCRVVLTLFHPIFLKSSLYPPYGRYRPETIIIIVEPEIRAILVHK